jgi:transcriptional regulator with XRE-family HTH domain
MTPSEFKEWREQLGLSQQFAGQLLGVSPKLVALYERAVWEVNNPPPRIPAAVELRCKNLAVQRNLHDELKMLESAEMTKREDHGEVNVERAWLRIQQLRKQLFDIDVILLAHSGKLSS